MVLGATGSGTSTVRSVPTRPMKAPPIRTPGFIARAMAGKASCVVMGHALMENRNGLVVGGGVTIASGTAGREAALDLIDKHHPVESKGGKRRITLGGDKGFDVAAFIEDLRGRKVTPHVAVQDRLTKTGKRRKTKIDGRTTRHPGYGVSQRCRKRIEEIFGWAKTQAGLSKTKFRGKRRVDASFTLALAAYNLIRLPRLLAEVPP